MAETTTKPDNKSIPVSGMAELLQDVPLHSAREMLVFSFPESIDVHCDHEKCQGVRRHEKSKSDSFKGHWNMATYYSVSYSCSNCEISAKIFILKVVDGQSPSVICTKIYQEPPFGQPIPKRLFHIIGEANREHFLQARRAIARGLGIGAYAYYRRIVENTKFDLVGSVLEVAQATNGSTAQIELLKKAQAERQFSKAMEMLQDVYAIPAVLLIEGRNPLSLLHDLFSEEMHQLNDGECLERAQEAEIILCEIADRMQIAMTERKSVKAAITSILNRKAVGEKTTATS
jgi:hypothetical protein